MGQPSVPPPSLGPPLPPPPPPALPGGAGSGGCQVRCASCSTILTVKYGLTKFVCPMCQMPQMLPLELLWASQRTVPAHDIDPTEPQQEQQPDGQTRTEEVTLQNLYEIVKDVQGKQAELVAEMKSLKDRQEANHQQVIEMLEGLYAPAAPEDFEPTQ